MLPIQFRRARAARPTSSSLVEFDLFCTVHLRSALCVHSQDHHVAEPTRPELDRIFCDLAMHSVLPRSLTRAVISSSRVSPSFSVVRARRSVSARCEADPRAFLHPTTREGHFAVSFLEEPPVDARVPTVIGLLKGDQLRPDLLEPNPNYLDLVHEVLRTVCGESVLLKTMATARATPGYIHISDERNPPVANRTAEPDDIVASVLVENAEVKPASYQPSTTYRLLTRDGLMRLNDELHTALMRGLQAAREVEHEMVAAAEKRCHAT